MNNKKPSVLRKSSTSMWNRQTPLTLISGPEHGSRKPIVMGQIILKWQEIYPTKGTNLLDVRHLSRDRCSANRTSSEYGSIYTCLAQAVFNPTCDGGWRQRLMWVTYIQEYLWLRWVSECRSTLDLILETTDNTAQWIERESWQGMGRKSHLPMATWPMLL